MSFIEKKKEIIDWVLTTENREVINEIYKFKNHNNSLDFTERFSKGLTIEEFKTEMKSRIKNYPQRK